MLRSKKALPWHRKKGEISSVKLNLMNLKFLAIFSFLYFGRCVSV